MTDGYMERRREYVASVRKSFDEKQDSTGINGEIEVTERGYFTFFKLRLLLAICLFGIFFYCHYTDTDIINYSSKQIVELISDNHYYTNLKNYVMIQERDAKSASVSEKKEDIFE